MDGGNRAGLVVGASTLCDEVELAAEGRAVLVHDVEVHSCGFGGVALAVAERNIEGKAGCEGGEGEEVGEDGREGVQFEFRLGYWFLCEGVVLAVVVGVVVGLDVDRLGDELSRDWSSMYGCFEDKGRSMNYVFGFHLRVR